LQRYDFQLLKNGFVHLYWSPRAFEGGVDSLAELGYKIVALDAAQWTTDDLLGELGRALDFPDYYGHNFDALNDCLRDVAGFEYGSDETSTGTALVLARFDQYAAREPTDAHVLLDIFADRARGALLIGHRMLCLVQSDDPDISFDPVGAVGVGWNPAEFFNASRHP
jgi:hypothetical protein